MESTEIEEKAKQVKNLNKSILRAKKQNDIMLDKAIIENDKKK